MTLNFPPSLNCHAARSLPSSLNAASAARAAEEPTAAAFAAVGPSVVAVGSLAGRPGAETFTPVASGIVWDQRGHIVAPYSQINPVLRQSPQQQVGVQLLLPDGSTAVHPASLVAREPSLELIVLRLEPPRGTPLPALSPVTLTSSAALRVGQDALLVGSTPDGQRTLSAGVVSAKGRSVPAPNGQAIRGCLQTDAELSPLGLGGALVDSGGRVIGMPTVAYTKPGSGRSSGVNFALPSDVLAEAVPKMIAYGSVSGRR